jgi:transposase
MSLDRNGWVTTASNAETRHDAPGSDSGGEHWALVAMLIQTAKVNKLDPLAWLTDVLERIVSGRTKRNELHTLLPWNWSPGCMPTTISSA